MVLNRENVTLWVVYPAALAILVGCIVFAFAQLVELLNPAWSVYHLVPVCALAAAEAYLVGRAIQQLPPGAFVNPWHVRAVELALWYLLLQVIADIQTHQAPVQHGLPYITPAAIGEFAVLLLCWLAATDSAQDFYLLRDVRPHIVLNFSPAERLTARFFKGGAFLLLFTGLSTIRVTDLNRFAKLDRPSVAGVIYNVLLYFAVGVVVLVQIRYEGLLRTWKRRNITISPGVPTRWLRYSLALLAIGIVVALVLPTDFTSGLLDAVNTIQTAITLLIGGIAFLFLVPFTWLLSLFHVSGAIAHHPPPPPHIPHSSHQHGQQSGIIAVVRSLLFWAAVVAAVVYLLSTYGSSLPRSGIGGFLRAILTGMGSLWLEWWKRLLSLRRVTAGGIRRSHRDGARSIARPPRRRRTLFPWLLPPREQVVWYYVGLIQRAGKRGHPRRIGQTPYEYDSALGPHVAESRDDLRALTEAYIEARYAPVPVTSEQAHRARTVWQRVLAALRRKQ